MQQLQTSEVSVLGFLYDWHFRQLTLRSWCYGVGLHVLCLHYTDGQQ